MVGVGNTVIGPYYFRKEYEEFKKKHPKLWFLYTPKQALIILPIYWVVALISKTKLNDVLTRTIIIYIITIIFMTMQIWLENGNPEFKK